MKKIWIDLENTPHVPLFKPIIEELNKLGYKTMVTVRDCFQVCALADLHNLSYKKIGYHYGKNKLRKLIGLFYRSMQLLPTILSEKPVLALSHGSRSQLILSKMLRIPTVMMDDYEPSKGLPFFNPDWSIIPEVISEDDLTYPKKYLRKYPGIKEDIYIPFLKPDANILREFNISENEIIVVIRPPATEAHYHNPESEVLFEAVIDFVCGKDDTQIVILPRNGKQTAEIKKLWPEWCTNGKIMIPDHVVDGLNLIWYSDLVISGGGTMNREAAALNVPVYSIFRGKIGAVDNYLSRIGRLTLIESIEDIPAKIVLTHRQRPSKPKLLNSSPLQTIVNSIVAIIENQQSSRRNLTENTGKNTLHII